MPSDKPVPEWVRETPPEATSYQLAMMNWTDCGTDQEIDLTRDEFIALKHHLARMHGLIPPDDIETPTEAIPGAS